MLPLFYMTQFSISREDNHCVNGEENSKRRRTALLIARRGSNGKTNGNALQMAQGGKYIQKEGRLLCRRKSDADHSSIGSCPTREGAELLMMRVGFVVDGEGKSLV